MRAPNASEHCRIRRLGPRGGSGRRPYWPGLAGALAIALALAAPAAASAQEREVALDHAGSVGLIAAAGPEWGTFEIGRCPTCQIDRVLAGFSVLLDVGGTVAVGQEGSELALRLRLVGASELRGVAAAFGYRHFFGFEELKTYFSFDLLADFAPALAGGARASFGAMYELSPVLGLYSEAGASFALGQGRRFGAELTFGLQARSYWLQ